MDNVRFTISSDSVTDDAIKHLLFVRDVNNHSEFFNDTESEDRSTSIILPSFILSPECVNEHVILIYLLHHLSSIIDHNRKVDARAKINGSSVDYDEYRDGRDAYVDTVLHYGAKAVVEYVNKMKNDSRVDLSRFDRLLLINANLYKNQIANPDHRPVDIMKVKPDDSRFLPFYEIETRL